MKKIENGYKGKAIYQPKGKASEYSYWACNFYVGCSNGCTYCYLKKGRGAKILGGDKPTLKKCFKDKNHALSIFNKELRLNYKELQKHGLFFTFTSDPFLDEAYALTKGAITNCLYWDIPVKILTKTGLKEIGAFELFCDTCKLDKSKIAIGYTLTGHDELEPFAAPNAERIEAMKFAKEDGFKTFASIEPIIDFTKSELMIAKTKHFCDHYKIGLESGKKYSPEEIRIFMNTVNLHLSFSNSNPIPTVYWKDSLLKLAKVKREELPSNCVKRDYNIFQ